MHHLLSRSELVVMAGEGFNLSFSTQVGTTFTWLHNSQELDVGSGMVHHP